MYLLPAGMVLAFDTEQLSDSQYPPFMEVLHSKADSKAAWTIDGEAAPLEAIPHLARELFGDLIRVASGVMSDSDLFADNNDNPVLGKNLAVGYEREQPPASASQAVAPGESWNPNQMIISDACDVVDGVIERELKRLYEEAAKLKPDSPETQDTRKKISAVESFRTKMLDAFEQFTHETHGLPLAGPPSAQELAGSEGKIPS